MLEREPEILATNDAGLDYVRQLPSDGLRLSDGTTVPATYTADGTLIFPLLAVASYFDMTPPRLRQLVNEKREGGPRVHGIKFGTGKTPIIFVSFTDVQSYVNSPSRRTPGPKRGFKNQRPQS